MSEEDREILGRYHANILKEMAIAAGIDITKNSVGLGKAALAKKLEAVYFSRERIAASYARLSELDKAVLDRLLLRGGHAETQSLRRELFRAKLVTKGRVLEHGDPGYDPARRVPYDTGYVGRPEPGDSTIFEDVIARLTFQGLVFSRPYDEGVTYKLQYHPDHTLFVPQAVRQYLPEPVPPVQAHWVPSKVYEEDPSLFLRDLYLYWDYVRRNEVPILKNGFVAKRALRAISQELSIAGGEVDHAQDESDVAPLHRLRIVLEGLGLLRAGSGRLVTTCDSPLDIPVFWGLDVADQIQQCLQVLLEISDFGVLALNPGSYYDAQFSDACDIFFEVFGKLEFGVWRSLGELLDAVWDHDVNFLIPGHAAVERHKGRGPYYYSSRSQLLLRPARTPA